MKPTIQMMGRSIVKFGWNRLSQRESFIDLSQVEAISPFFGGGGNNFGVHLKSGTERPVAIEVYEEFVAAWLDFNEKAHSPLGVTHVSNES